MTFLAFLNGLLLTTFSSFFGVSIATKVIKDRSSKEIFKKKGKTLKKDSRPLYKRVWSFIKDNAYTLVPIYNLKRSINLIKKSDEEYSNERLEFYKERQMIIEEEESKDSSKETEVKEDEPVLEENKTDENELESEDENKESKDSSKETEVKEDEPVLEENKTDENENNSDELPNDLDELRKILNELMHKDEILHEKYEELTAKGASNRIKNVIVREDDEVQRKYFEALALYRKLKSAKVMDPEIGKESTKQEEAKLMEPNIAEKENDDKDKPKLMEPELVDEDYAKHSAPVPSLRK